MLTLVLILSACSGSTDTPETASVGADPVAVVNDWLDAVAEVDIQRITNLVEPTGLAIVAAVENNLRSEELAGMLESGIPPELGTEYWDGFRRDFGSIRGSAVDEIEVGDELTISAPDGFTGVEISIGETTGRVILRLSDDGWKVDFAATVGPALVGPLGEYLASAIEGEYGALIVDSYRFAVVPALTAVAELEEDNSVLVFETEYIRQLVSP